MTRTFTAFAAGLLALTFSFGTFAATGEQKAAKKQVEANYKSAKTECKKLSGAEHKDCMNKAKADYKTAEKQLKAQK